MHTDRGCGLLRHDTRPRHGVADLALRWCNTCSQLLIPERVGFAEPITVHPDSTPSGAREATPRSSRAARRGAGLATQPA